jgi:hypothetical protein
MEGSAKKVEIGFDGGQVLSVRITDDQLGDLLKAVREGSGWRELASEEGAVSLELSKVVFVRAAGGPHTIGFSGS